MTTTTKMMIGKQNNKQSLKINDNSNISTKKKNNTNKNSL